MKLNFLKKLWRPALMLLLAVIMVASVVSGPQAAASTYKASSIEDIKFVDGCENGYAPKDNGNGTYGVQYAVRLHLTDPATGEAPFVPYIEGT